MCATRDGVDTVHGTTGGPRADSNLVIQERSVGAD